MRILLIVGAVNAVISVACGAFGAHGLEGKLTAHYLEVWETACRYQMYHAIGIIVLALLKQVTGIQLFGTAGWVMFAGIVIFSGSLFVLALSGVKVLGAITPIGGVLFIASWVMVVISALKVN